MNLAERCEQHPDKRRGYEGLRTRQKRRNLIMFAGVGFIMICMCLGFYCLGIVDGYEAALENNPRNCMVVFGGGIEGYENWGGYNAGNIDNDGS